MIGQHRLPMAFEPLALRGYTSFVPAQLLELPFDPENLRLLAHQKDAALTIISQQIRIEAERLRAPPARGGSVEEFYRRYDGGCSEKSER